MISVIIPVYRETDEVMHRLRRIADACRDSQAECIIAAVEGDALPGGLSGLPGISLTCSSAGRAAQMNCGAQIARGDTLLFCHADSTPPPEFLRLIDDAVRRGVRIGAFRLRFDGGVRMRITALLTNWRARLSGVPYGDQGLFITRELFAQLGGSRRAAFRAAELPQLVPALAAGASVVFLVAFSDYFLVFLAGGGVVPSFTGYLFPFLNSSERNIASALSLVFLLVPLMLFAVLNLLLRLRYGRTGVRA